MQNLKSNYTRFMLFLGGMFILVLGVAMILRWFPDVVSFLKGTLGMGLAMGGLLMLYSLNKK